MVIQHNIAAMNVFRNMQMQGKIVNKALQRLSSGQRINSAADDPAGLAISEKMRGQIRGLKMASQNAQNAVSMLQTAEGGLNEVHDIAQRMRELATQAANGTYTDLDREMLSKEYEALKQEIDRISGYTNYNGIKLLDGSAGGKTGEKGLELLGLSPGAITITGGVKGTGRLDFRINENGSGHATLQLGEKTYYEKINTGDLKTSFDLGGMESVTVDFSAGELKSGVLTNVKFSDTGVDISKAIGGNESTDIVFQIGANSGSENQLRVRIENMSTVNLGFVSTGKTLANSSILTQQDAVDAIDVIDRSINMVSMQRASIGAQINRLGHTINNLETTAENLQAAESSIRDADMAEEMMNFTKHNILLQAAQAMMAQAMQQSQGILQLLR